MTTKTGSAMEVKVIQNEAGEGVSRYLLTTSSLGSFEVVLDGCVLRRHRGASNHPLKRGLASWTVSPYFFFFFSVLGTGHGTGLADALGTLLIVRMAGKQCIMSELCMAYGGIKTESY